VIGFCNYILKCLHFYYACYHFILFFNKLHCILFVIINIIFNLYDMQFFHSIYYWLHTYFNIYLPCFTGGWYCNRVYYNMYMGNRYIRLRATCKFFKFQKQSLRVTTGRHPFISRYAYYELQRVQLSYCE